MALVLNLSTINSKLSGYGQMSDSYEFQLHPLYGRDYNSFLVGLLGWPYKQAEVDMPCELEIAFCQTQKADFSLSGC